MSKRGSVVVDLLLMVLGLQVLGYGPQAGCQYLHHPLTVGWFLQGERLHKLELMQVMCFWQAGYSLEFLCLGRKVSACQKGQLGVFSGYECLGYDRQHKTISSPHEMAHSKDNVTFGISL